jgi:hypothetical protein
MNPISKRNTPKNILLSDRATQMLEIWKIGQAKGDWAYINIELLMFSWETLTFDKF